MPKPVEYVTCETSAAIVVHIREIGETPIKLGGHWPKPKALCDAEISWDMQTVATKFLMANATCSICRNKYLERVKSHEVR